MAEQRPLLEIEGLTKRYELPSNVLRRSTGKRREAIQAVRDVSLSISPGETVGLVGESGCGKSTLARLLVHLEPPTAGRIVYEGMNLLDQDSKTVRQFRRKIQIVFQDPYSSLNPRMSVGRALREVLAVHKLCPREQRQQRAGELLRRVGLSPDMMDRRPREFSGGQRQRIGIARALAVEPNFIVADEPLSALDVSVQAQVLNLMMRLQEEMNLTYLFISHNLGVIRHISQRVAIMYLGRLVEVAPTTRLFESPLHPYTQALLRAVPSLNPDEISENVAVEGDIPNAINPPSGCHFHPRCPFAMPICRERYPAMRTAALGHTVACHLYPGTKPESTAAPSNREQVGRQANHQLDGDSLRQGAKAPTRPVANGRESPNGRTGDISPHAEDESSQTQHYDSREL
jgi:oligopeptide/dipeptide ABC transporter ATP-binding protein